MFTDHASIPTLDIDPFDTAALASAPGHYDEVLREAGPVAWLPAINSYGVSRHAEVEQVLQDWQHFESGPGVGISNFRTERKWRATSILLEADPPLHDAPRRVLASVLGPAAQRGVRQRWQKDAEVLVDGLLLDGSQPVLVDGVADLAAAYPLRVVPDAIGIAEEGRDRLLPFSDFLLNAFGPRNALVRDGQARGGPLSSWVDTQCQRRVFREGSWGHAVWQACDDGDITPEQAPLVLRSLFAAGVNTTVHALAAILLALARHPEQWQLIHDRPELRGRVLDEAIRWQSPIQTMFRTTRGTPRIGGVPLLDSAKVLVCLGAANRDPRRWPEPEHFDLTRPVGGHLGFGAGIHECVGQHLARLEADCLLRALSQRVGRIELAGEAVRQPNNTLNSWASIPLRLHPFSRTAA